MLPLGILPNLPAEQYHQRKLGLVSKSALDEINRTAAHYRAWVDGSDDDEESKALRFGRALHCAALEPDEFSTRFVAEPDFGDCRFKENKLRRNAWRAENADRTHVTDKEMVQLRGMMASVQRHQLAKRTLSGGLGEVTVSWQDGLTGLFCKSRADYYVKRLAMVVDIKSTEDASPEGFRRSVEKYRYFVQDALYRDGFSACGEPIDHFVFVAVEKTPPYLVALYTLDAAGISTGYGAARRNISKMAECLEKNEWPGHPVEIQTLSLSSRAA